MAVSVDIQALRDKSREIAELDEILDAASGSTTAGKRSISKQLAAENADVWSNVADQLVTMIKGLDSVDEVIGAVSGIKRTLDENFKDQMQTRLDVLVEERKKEVPELSPEELTKIETDRKSRLDEFRALQNILEMFGEDVSTVPEPSARRGSRGPRGPRVLSEFDYYINGTKRTDTQNSLGSIAATVCKDLNWKAKDLRDHLKDQGINLEEPPDVWEASLPTEKGDVLRAVRKSTTDVYEVDDDEDEEENSEEDDD